MDSGVGIEVEARRRFEDVTLPHLKALYGYAVKLTRDRSVAEDLVQETYLKALVAFPSLRDPFRAKAWLFRILSRLVVDHYRNELREVAQGDAHDLDRFSLYDLIWDEDPLPYSDRLHDEFLAEFRDDEVRAALLALPEVYRVPLVLLYVEELTYKELAAIMNCPIGTVMSRLHRGRKILERELWECARRRGLVKTWKAPSN